MSAPVKDEPTNIAEPQGFKLEIYEALVNLTRNSSRDNGGFYDAMIEAQNDLTCQRKLYDKYAFSRSFAYQPLSTKPRLEINSHLIEVANAQAEKRALAQSELSIKIQQR